MVIINENDKAYYESIGMLEKNMKRFEQERIRLGLPDNCTLEELNKAMSIAEQGKINDEIEKKARKSEIDFVRNELQIPESITDQQIDRVLNIRMERLTAINGSISYDDTQKKYTDETTLHHSR